jgi:hypothetical protein
MDAMVKSDEHHPPGRPENELAIVEGGFHLK